MRRVAAAVLHLQEVADGVVHVALDVGAHGVRRSGWSCRVWNALKASGAVGGLRSPLALPQVFAAGGLDQPVEGVVGVVVARLDALVAGSRWSAARRRGCG